MDELKTITEQLIGIEIVSIIQIALMVNLGVLGSREIIQVFKKIVTDSPLPVTFDLHKPTTMLNVLFGLALAIIFSYQMIPDHNLVEVGIASIKIWLVSFVTWKVGLKQLVEIIPTILDAIKKKIDSIGK